MSIARHEGRMQLCCDNCPASFPATYPDDGFHAMVADAKASGWSIAKAMPSRDRDTTDLFKAPPRLAGNAKAEPYKHACPACAAGDKAARLF